MRTVATLAAVLLLSGCEAPPFDSAGGCTLPGFGGLLTEDSRSCSCIVAQVDRAREALEGAGLVAPGFDWSGVTLWLRASGNPLDPLPGRDNHPLARYLPKGEGEGWIESERWGRALAHELFHHVEIVRDGAGWEQTAAHLGWEERGVNAVDEAFQRTAEPGARGSCY